MHVRAAVLEMEEGCVEASQAIRGHALTVSQGLRGRVKAVSAAGRAPRGASWRPATRTPSRRTGRRGSSVLSSSSATPSTVSSSFTAPGGCAPGNGREVGEAHLDPDRAPAGVLARERVAELARESLQHRLELLEPVEVAIEGGLARPRLGRPGGLDLALVLEAREGTEVPAEPRAEPAGERLVRVAPSAPSVLIPSESSRSAVFGPMPGTSRGEAAAKRSRAPARR